jgi:hypothetical protein
MNMRLSLSVTAALLGSCLIAMPASAAPFPVSKALSAQAGEFSSLLQVQGMTPAQPANRAGASGGGSGPRTGGGGQRQGGGGQRHGGGGQRYDGGHRGHGGGGGDGGAVAAGVFGGLLLGAIIANESQRNDCRRYRSYDRRSGTFIAGDGRRYRCP